MQICGRRKSSLPPCASAESSSLHQRRVCQPGEQILGAPSGIEASVSAGCCLSISLSSSQLPCSVLTSSCSSLSWQHSFSTSPRQDRERHLVSPQPETGALRSPSAAQSESRCCCAGAGWCCSCQGASSSPLHELTSCSISWLLRARLVCVSCLLRCLRSFQNATLGIVVV